MSDVVRRAAHHSCDTTAASAAPDEDTVKSSSPRTAITAASFLVTAAAMCLVATPVAHAQDASASEESASSPIDEDGPVVRRRLLYRSTRFEASPLVAFSLADPFNRNIIGGVNLGFHITNSLSVNLTGGYQLANFATPLRENIGASVPDDEIDDIAYSQIQWLGSLEGMWVPLFGKFSLMDSVQLAYDLHLIVGVGLIGREAVADSENNAGPPNVGDLEGASASVVAGFGGRFYINDFISINTDVRDYILLSSSRISGGESELQNNLIMSVGASFFFPRKVKVSR